MGGGVVEGGQRNAIVVLQDKTDSATTSSQTWARVPVD